MDHHTFPTPLPPDSRLRCRVPRQLCPCSLNSPSNMPASRSLSPTSVALLPNPGPVPSRLLGLSRLSAARPAWPSIVLTADSRSVRLLLSTHASPPCATAYPVFAEAPEVTTLEVWQPATVLGSFAAMDSSAGALTFFLSRRCLQRK